jgi:pyruvate/2-oxoglutarate dehydrogenase complex dihydrolipoamide dehydrogenase (E3) component
MEKTYDLIVVGAGSAGLSAAEFAAQIGARVALVEKNRVGGDCTWTGCVPSKTLMKAARVAHTVRTAATFGIQAEPPQVDMSQVWSHVQQVIQEIYRQETPEMLAKSGIEVVHGAARFVDPHTVEVGQRKLSGKNFILASGTHPFIPPIPGLDETPYLSCKQIFDNDSLPERLVVLGAGASGVEIAQAYGRLGSAVTLIDIGLLPSFDPDVGEVLAKVFRREGIQFVAGLAAAVSHIGSQYHIAINNKDQLEITADMLLVAAGRLPNVTGMGLDNAGVVYDLKGVKVDQKLRTSAKHIYAAGDCTGGFQSTHYAGLQGYKAVRNILLPGSQPGVRSSIPVAAYTDPEIAHVGLSEARSRALYGASMQAIYHPLSRVDRAVIEREQDGFIKIIYKSDGTLLGATIVAPRAGEMITEFEIALQHGLKIRDLAEAMHVYPAYSMGVQRVAADVATKQFFASKTGRIVSRLAGFTPS